MGHMGMGITVQQHRAISDFTICSGMHLLKHLTVNGLHRSMGPSMSLWSYLDGIATLYADVMKTVMFSILATYPAFCNVSQKSYANVFKSSAHPAVPSTLPQMVFS
jgi:hypothetical protein